MKQFEVVSINFIRRKFDHSIKIYTENHLYCFKFVGKKHMYYT